MNPLNRVSHVRKKIGELEQMRSQMEQKLQRVQLLKQDGVRYYQGTELPIDDVIFSIREGQVRSLQITLDFYRQTLHELNPTDSLSGSVGGEMGLH